MIMATPVFAAQVAVNVPVEPAMLRGSGVLLVLAMTLYFLYNISTRLVLIDPGMLRRPLTEYRTVLIIGAIGNLLGGGGMMLYASGLPSGPLWAWAMLLSLSYLLVIYVINSVINKAHQIQQRSVPQV